MEQVPADDRRVATIAVDAEPTRVPEFHEGRARMNLAQWTLLAVAITMAAAAYAYITGSGEPAKAVFSAATTILPPIATLVLSTYFRNSRD